MKEINIYQKGYSPTSANLIVEYIIPQIAKENKQFTRNCIKLVMQH